MRNRITGFRDPRGAKFFHIGLLLVVLAVVGAAQADSPDDPPSIPPPAAGEGPAAAADRYIVVLKNSVADADAKAAKHGNAYGARVSRVFGSALKGYAAEVPAERLAALKADPDVESVVPDTAVSITAQTAATGVQRIRAAGKTNRGAGVQVAVIDTGIEAAHPDLAANVVGGTNCSTGGKRSFDDGHGHGTHVAGIIAALDNGDGVVGVAPEAKLWGVRVLDDKGMGWVSDIVCGIDFVDSKSPARGGPITVANMSLGGFGYDDGNCGRTNGDPMHQAVCRAVSDGVTFVVAAGNSGVDISGEVTFVPASYEEVITVSALQDSDGQPCGAGGNTKYGADDDFPYWSNYASSPTDLGHLLAAPGVSIYSTYKGGGYQTLSGTSMASPHVAGSAALYIASHPGATPAGVRDALRAMAEPVNTSFNSECGGATKNTRSAKVSHTDGSGKHPEPAVRDDTL
jgi:subtilisin